MKYILRISLLATIGVCLALTTDAEEEKSRIASFSGYDINHCKRYDFDVYEEDLDQNPSWRTEDEYPPLSPRRAEMSARAQLRELVPESERWTLDTIALKTLSGVSLKQIDGSNKWVYVVHFRGFHPPGVQDGMVSTMRVVVFMDGRAVKPTVSTYKPRR